MRNLDKYWLVVLPKNHGSFESQLESCFSFLENALVKKNLTNNNILKFTFFLKADNNLEFEENRRTINRLLVEYDFGKIPASFAAQAPEQGYLLSIEVLLSEYEGYIHLKNYNSINYLIRNSIFGEELIATGITCKYPQINDTEIQYGIAFRLMSELLAIEGFTFDQVVRQWNYIENILAKKDGNGNIFQNYQLFNDIRSKYYSSSFWENGYPAATGIGTNAGTVSIDFIALKPNSGTKIVPVKNPRQTDAHSYSQNVLAGSKLIEKTTPKFERAKIILNGKFAEMYVSGTAAIIGEETVSSDIETQTLITIENINKLIESETTKQNFTSLEQVQNSSLKQELTLKHYKAYIKNFEDFEIVRDLCKSAFPNASGIFVKADICRDDLLVEIEGFM